MKSKPGVKSGKDLLQCDYCDRTFSKSDHRKRHERSHTNTKPYECDICGNRYARSDVLARHQLSHNSKDDRKAKIRKLIKVTDDQDQANSSVTSSHVGPSSSTLNSEPTGSKSVPFTNEQDQHNQHDLSPTALPHLAADELSSSNVNMFFDKTAFMEMDNHEFNSITSGINDNNTYQSASASASTSTSTSTSTAASANFEGSEEKNNDVGNTDQGFNVLDQIWQVPLLDFSSIVRPISPEFNFNSLPPMVQLGTPEYDSPNGKTEELMHVNDNSSNQQPNTIVHSDPFDATMPILSNLPKAQQQEIQQYSDLQEQEKVPQQSKGKQNTVNHRLIRSLWPTKPTKKPFLRSQVVTKNTAQRLIIDQSTTNRLNSMLKAYDKAFQLPLLSPFLYTELLTLYFENWHPVLPLLHKPTFDPQSTSSLLLLSLCAIGTFFLDQPNARQLGDALVQPLVLNITIQLSPALSKLANNDEVECDILQVIQASLLRQTYSLLSGTADGIHNAKAYQHSPTNIGLEHGLFSPDYNNIYLSDDSDTNEPNKRNGKASNNGNDDETELDLEWRKWAHNEVRKRTAFFFLLNDSFFSQFFITSPKFQSGAIDFSLPCPDALFSALNAQSWSDLLKVSHQASTPYHELCLTLFIDPHSVLTSPAITPLGLETFMATILGVVLSSAANRRHRDIDIDESSELVAPLTKALIESVSYIPKSGAEDEFAAGIHWNTSWIHLLIDMKAIERACGREGLDQQSYALERLKSWPQTSRARRLILHAIDIQMRILERPFGVQALPHVYISCFHAWMILQAFLKLVPDSKEIYVPWIKLDWRSIGSAGISSSMRRPMVLDSINKNIMGSKVDSGLAINRWILYDTQPQADILPSIPTEVPSNTTLHLVKLVNVLEKFSTTIKSLGHLPIYENIANLIDIASSQVLS